MKQRLAGKIIKHPERYTFMQRIRAYERSVRSLRKYYKRLHKNGEGWSNYYIHEASKPFHICMEDVDQIWNVKY